MSSPRSKPSLRAKLILLGASLLLSLPLAELVASIARRGAFPYLNIYENSARYGVVLEPSARVRVRSRTGRISEISTNTLGFRGTQWSEHKTKPRVLLLGDSQMLGYGVDADDAIAARLSAIAGVEVLNAAVPSWGPFEYALAVEELAPVYRPDVVLFVANLSNDWVEATVANVKRSAAADGWIVRKRSDAPPVINFPGRRFLLSRSHLVFAVRGLAALSGSGASMPDALPGATAAEHLLRDLPLLSRGRDGFRSRVTPHLAQVVKTCTEHGCRVIAAGLPLDVQVDAAEWSKYQSAPRDLSTARSLMTAFLDDAASLGVTSIDLFEPLAASSPGAFLSDDVHLSPRGHDAIARALAESLAEETHSEVRP